MTALTLERSRADRQGRIALRGRPARTIDLRRFAVEGLLNAAVLGLIAAIGTNVVVPQPFPFGSGSAPVLALGPDPAVGVLILGWAVAAAERVLRPLLEALAGRWLLATLGAIPVVVSAVTLWLATLFVQGIGFRTASPGLVWLLVTAVLFTILRGGAQIALGLDRVAVDRSGRGGAVWRALDRLPTPRRNGPIENLRLRQVYETIAATAVDIALEGTRLGAFREAFRRRILGLPGPPRGCRAARRVRLMLEDLGPTYVKLGQMAAARIDALPEEWRAELSELNRSASPFPWPDASVILTADLRGLPEELFGHIDPLPFAAASTAQVHRATLRDGRAVVVKIQRPRIAASTKADLGVLIQLADVAERHLEPARRIGARAIVGEFAGSVLAELDYRNEAYNARRLADAMGRQTDVRVPAVHPELSGEHVLTEDDVSGGIRLSEINRLREAELDPAALGATFVRAMIRQILVDGFFHADPHDGNVVADARTGQIVFLDFGQVGELSRAQRFELLGLIHGVRSADATGIGDSLLALSIQTPEFDERRFRSAVDRLVREVLVYGRSDSLGAAIGRLLGALVENGLRLDGQLTMAIKAVAQTEATARRLATGIDLAAIAIAEATAAVHESLSPEQIRRRAEVAAIHVGKEVVRRLPTLENAALSWLDGFSKGRLTVELDTSNLERSVGRAGEVGRHATVGVIVVGQLIGTAIVMSTLLRPELGDFQLFGVLAMGAFGLSLAVSFAVLRRVLRHRRSEGG